MSPMPSAADRLPSPARWLPRMEVTWGRRSRALMWAAVGAVVVVAGAAMAMWGMFPLDLHGPTHYMGIMSPSCGATRSVVATFRGDLGLAWRYNPAGPLVALASVAGLAMTAVGAASGRWLVLRVRPGRLGWALIVAALVALELRQQSNAGLLMTTGLR